jgi:hypothetical protein
MYVCIFLYFIYTKDLKWEDSGMYIHIFSYIYTYIYVCIIYSILNGKIQVHNSYYDHNVF